MEIIWQTPANPPEVKDYIFVKGKRYVMPYYFEFIAHVKNRWEGKTIVDLFSEEFRGRTYEYYVSAVKNGRIKVDGQMVPVSYILQSTQKISHFVHRHEPPVLAGKVSILQTESDVITVCKPASIPVHPCGQYRKNTVVGILQAEHGLAPLFHFKVYRRCCLNEVSPDPYLSDKEKIILLKELVVNAPIINENNKHTISLSSDLGTSIHRLDRLVSGLLIFARNADKAEQFRRQIHAGLLEKEYIARVVGIFPDGEHVVNANLCYDAREGRTSVETWGQSSVYTILIKGMDTTSFTFTEEMCENWIQDGRLSDFKGKDACTIFSRISTNGAHSVVLCKPVTGRTHQIRAHLQYTGYPIANDKLYPSKPVAHFVKGTGTEAVASTGEDQLLASDSLRDNRITEAGNWNFAIDPMCTNCPGLAPTGYDGDVEGIWLHCVRYSGPGWSYECPFPEWASFH